MKTKKLLLLAALLGAASLSAQAGVRFCFSFGLALPAPVVVTAPVAPVVVSAPVVAVPPVVVAAPVYAAPVYAAPNYVWAPGYWSVCGHSRVWVPGCWRCRPVYAGWGHPYGWRR